MPGDLAHRDPPRYRVCLFEWAIVGYSTFFRGNSAIVLFLLPPLAAILSVQLSVIVSSRISDVRTGEQAGVLTVIPLAGLYVAGELNIVQLGSSDNLLIIGGIILVVDVLLFHVTRATFRMEEILTRWK